MFSDWSEPRSFLQIWVESGPSLESDDEAQQVQRRADHSHPEGAGSRDGDGGCVPSAWREQRHFLQVEGQVRWA